MKKYLIAHDLGTSGNKASLFSTDGELICTHTVEYGVDFFGGNCAEQNPEDWWNAVKVATKEITKNIEKKDVLALSFSAQMQACIVVNREGKALRNAMIWADMRAIKEAKILEEKIGFDEMYRLTGHRVAASYSIEKLMWIKENEPEIFEQTHKMLLAKDFIICKMTGEFVTDYSEASGTNALDLENLCWSERILEAAGIDESLMPTLHQSTDVIGNLKESVVEELGLTKDVAIVCGGGDGPCSALGAGCVEDDQMFMSLGTSAWIGGTTDEVFLDEKKVLFCFGHVVPGKYMPCGTMQAAGSSYAYIKEALCQEEEKLAKEKEISVYELLNQMVEQSKPGANGLIFLPYMLGERSPRWNPYTSSSFLGIKADHNKNDYVRAVLEGVAMNLSLILEAYRRNLNIEQMVLTGGGAKGEIFNQILANVLNVSLNRVDHTEAATSIAAAVLAGVGIGVFKDCSEIKSFIQTEATIEAKEDEAECYKNNKLLFNQGYECLKPYFELERNLNIHGKK